MSFLIIKSGTSSRSRDKLTVIVSAKVARKAVTRNLIKRRIREVMHPIIKKINTPVVVIARPQAKDASFQDLKKEMKEHFSIGQKSNVSC